MATNSKSVRILFFVRGGVLDPLLSFVNETLRSFFNFALLHGCQQKVLSAPLLYRCKYTTASRSPPLPETVSTQTRDAYMGTCWAGVLVGRVLFFSSPSKLSLHDHSPRNMDSFAVFIRNARRKNSSFCETCKIHRWPRLLYPR